MYEVGIEVGEGQSVCCCPMAESSKVKQKFALEIKTFELESVCE